MLCHNVWFFIPLKFLLIFLKEYKADKNEHQSRQSYSWYLRYTLQRCYEWKDGTATLLNSMKKKLIHFFTKLYVNRQENYRCKWIVYYKGLSIFDEKSPATLGLIQYVLIKNKNHCPRLLVVTITGDEKWCLYVSIKQCKEWLSTKKQATLRSW